MAGRINLYTVDHHNPPLTKREGIVHVFPIAKGDHLFGVTSFADMIAQYGVWQGITDRYFKDDDIIGFQGYRKHLDFRIDRKVGGDWVSLDPLEFRQYQNWQQEHAGPNIEAMLTRTDILTNPPYDVTHNGDIRRDFAVSASLTDWQEMERVLRRHGIVQFDIPTVTSYCVFTGTGKIFDEWMKFWWEVVCELTATLPATCPDPGPRPDIYLPRRMAFLSERIYSLWLANSGLRTKALPLLFCQELQHGV
jgi:hypothetical protein